MLDVVPKENGLVDKIKVKIFMIRDCCNLPNDFYLPTWLCVCVM